MVATAQLTFNSKNDPSSPQSAVGGTPAFDLIYLDGLGPGVPLRKGNVIPGSERVQLNGEVLKSGLDYGMDYAAGVVYVERAIKPGMSLTVFYRYDDKAQPSNSSGGLNAMEFELLPGQLSMIAGMGMAERNPDGSLASTNLFGISNNYDVGAGKLGGLLLFGQKKRVQSQQLMGFQGAEGQQQAGNSDLILQNFSTNVGKGRIDASYQDISKNFSDFGSALAAGYDAKVVDQLNKEKGLKRLGFGMTGMQFGGLDVSNSFKSVRDGANEIDWKSFGLKEGGFGFNFSSQSVSKGFSRFADLSEADKAQLAKEAGMSRQNIGADFAQKFGKLSFTDNSISDGAGQSIDRKELCLDSSKFKFKLGDQTVGPHFARITSVLPAEQAMYGAELGVHRQWMALDANLDKNLQPVHLALTDLSTTAGSFKSSDFSAGGKTWSLEHSDREFSKGFASFGALGPDAPNQLKTIANMYQKDPIAFRPQDSQIYLSSPGISRDFNRITLAPVTGFNLMAQRLEIKTPGSNSVVDTANLTSKHFKLDFRHENLGAGLDTSQLMLFERDRLGALAGINRTDIGLLMDLGPSKSLTVSQTQATLGADSLAHDSAEYKDKRIDVQANMRNVSPGSTFVNQLVDPDQKNLATLIGYKERDVKIAWQILPAMKLEAYNFDAQSDALSQNKKLSNLLFDWKPNKTTDVNYYHYQNHNFDPTQILFANSIDRFTLFKDFGKLGKFQFIDEKQNNDGSQNTAPGSEKQSITYEAQIDNRTSVRTEETSTKYDDGTKEDTSTQTLSTALTKHMGVSVSDVKIDRPGTAQDQNKRNYGFWFDVGHGVRFNYGYARQLDGSAGFLQNQASLTGGQIGDWRVGNGAYTNNFWDTGDRTQTTTQFALGTVKPVKLAFFKDVTMNLGWDTSADHSVWLKENKIFGFAGKLGYNQLGFDYHSQVLQTNQRGIDRGFTFKTDPNEKKWLRSNIAYKERVMPDGTKIAIRNLTNTARVAPGMELTNSVVTNPEQPNAGVLLGSVPLANRKNSWKLEFKPLHQIDPYRNSYSFGANWDELFNDQNKTLTRTAGATYKISFANRRPSRAIGANTTDGIAADDPLHSALTFYYGIEQNDTTALRRLAQRYYFQFDQRPGANQSLNLLFGNLSYEHSIADGFHRDNWTAGVNYQFRF